MSLIRFKECVLFIFLVLAVVQQSVVSAFQIPNKFSLIRLQSTSSKSKSNINGIQRSNPNGSLRMGQGNNNNGGMDDPNPGAMNNWDDNNNNDDDEDENFFDSLKEYFKSEEGAQDFKTYTLSLTIALLLRFTIVEPRYIPSLSMFPTFDIGDQLAVEKVTKRIRPFNRNEVVVFNPPDEFRRIIEGTYGGSSKKTKEALIKRIVAIEVRFVLMILFMLIKWMDVAVACDLVCTLLYKDSKYLVYLVQILAFPTHHHFPPFLPKG